MQLEQLLPLTNRYFVMRHGESLANEAGVIVSDPRRGTKDWGLTKTGRRQAESSARRYDGPDLAHIYCSDFLRARETAEIAARVFNDTPVKTACELRERYFGNWDGGSVERYPCVWALDAADPCHCEDHVESVVSVSKRMLSLIDVLEHKHARQNLLLVSHGDPLQILQTVFAGISMCHHRTLPHLEVAEIRPMPVPLPDR